MYYGVICIDLFIILRDPFKSPASGSVRTHIVILICSIFVPTILAVSDGLQFRPDFQVCLLTFYMDIFHFIYLSDILVEYIKFVYIYNIQICFLKYRPNISYVNSLVIYIPAAILVLGGTGVTINNYCKLKIRKNEATFKLRWSAMKRQMWIVFALTVSYIGQGIIWIIVFNDDHNITKDQPYLLSVFALWAMIVDGFAWFIKNYLTQKDLADTNHKNITISDALRKEVITFIVAGLSTSLTFLIQNEKKNKSNVKEIMRNVSDVSKPTSNNNTKTSISTNDNDGITHSSKDNMPTHNIPGTSSRVFGFSSTKEMQEPLLKIRNNDNNITNNKSDNKTFINVSLVSPMSRTTSIEPQFDSKFYPDSVNVRRGNNKYGVIIRPIGVCGKESHDVNMIDYAPYVFSYLRKKIFRVSNKQYLRSILPSGQELTQISAELTTKFSEGRSGAFFFFTKDTKYLIKTLTSDEANLLLTTLRSYVTFMKQNSESLLSKYFGMHGIELYNHRIYFVVTKNVFPPEYGKPHETYDLKGSWVDRHTNHGMLDNKLMKDMDLHRTLILEYNLKLQLYKQLELDTQWLLDNNIMDYSLLLGIYYTKVQIPKYSNDNNNESKNNLILNHDNDVYIPSKIKDYQKHEQKIISKNKKYNGDTKYDIYDACYVEGPGRYAIGIIDMLQEWNLNKKEERYLKIYIRGKDADGISCLNPIKYRQRFLRRIKERVLDMKSI